MVTWPHLMSYVQINYIGSIDFESDISPRHWAMRGVALLCDIK